MAEAVKLYQEIGFPALQKGSHEVGSPRLQFASATLPSVLDPSGSRITSMSRIVPVVNSPLIRPMRTRRAA